MLSKIHKIKSLALLFILSFVISSYFFGYPKIQAFTDFFGLKEDPKVARSIPRVVQAVSHIQKRYYDKSRIQPDKMFQAGLMSLSLAIPNMLVKKLKPVDQNQRVKIDVGTLQKNFDYPVFKNLAEILVPTASIFDFVQKNYDGELTLNELEYAFIEGMLKSLDPHSAVFSPEIFKEFLTSTTGEYGGLGIAIGMEDDQLVVLEPFENSPATKVGLLPDDIIVAIDGVPTINMPLRKAVERMKGKPRTKVTLLIKRKDQKPKPYQLVREKIQLKSVRSKLVSLEGKNFGVILITSFQQDTFIDLQKALAKMLKKVPYLDGVVLDLRDNPGGLLTQSIRVVDKFLAKGEIVYTQAANGKVTDPERARPGNDLNKTPLLVLVNQGSASASEIVSGALKRNKRAVVIGQQTFGKGSIQTTFALNDGSYLKMTIAQYLTTGKVSIQAVGITPDIWLNPMKVEKHKLDIFPNEFFGEAKLDEHLENEALALKEKPVLRLNYLDLEEPKKKLRYSRKIEPKTDYTLQFALKILARNESNQKDQMLQLAKKVVEEEQKLQNQKLETKLKELGIDFSETNKANSQKFNHVRVISRWFDEKGEAIQKEVVAGKTYLWELELSGLPTAMDQLLVVIDSKNSLINQKEFVFGKVNPNEVYKQRIEVEVPATVARVDEKIGLKFIQGFNKEPLAIKELPLVFSAKPKPSFSYRFRLYDDGQFGSKGNGDGRFQVGETIGLAFEIKNLNQNQADKLSINISNAGGDEIRLKKARLSQKLLKPAQKYQDFLSFEVIETLTKEDKLDLLINDKESRASLSYTIELFDKEALFKEWSAWYRAPDIQNLSYKIKKPTNLSLRFDVEDDDLKDVMVYVDGDKVFYEAKKEKNQSFLLDLELEAKELNTISIKARDQSDLASFKTFLVKP